ncbi:MAG TPA: N-methyl-L-tryptophan oxidase [Gemmatimonadales bacterium]|nr:N-methyl-L-tryptophan oxidase [Gemmatimonadales bacterium]
MKKDYEYIVLGLGGFGSAAAYWLSKRAGAEVLGLEQFELGHIRGESQDHSRIIRLSYHTPAYVELAKHAFRAWAQLEKDSGEHIVLKTGGLDLGPRVSAIPLTDYSGSMDAAGVSYETLDAKEIMRRWPPFRLTDGIHGLFQPESGIAMAARGNAAHQRVAQELGATLRERASVEAIRPLGGEIEIEAGGERYRCRRLVIAAGSWSNRALAPFGVQLPLRVTQEQVTYFATSRPADFQPGHFPIWIWMDEPCFYGLPILGEQGPKVGQHAGGREVTADTRTFEPDQAALGRVQDFLARYIPSALGPIIYTKSCLYTLTPDRDFVLDALPGFPNVVVAIGGGHGFKFASLIGRILSELAIDGSTERNIQPFRLDRAALELAGPPKNYRM